VEFELFNVEYYRDLEVWVRGHSRSLKVVPFKSWVRFPIRLPSGEGNLRPRRPPREYLSEYTSRGKPKISPADRFLMDPGHKARKNPSDNADLGFQAVGPALRIM